MVKEDGGLGGRGGGSLSGGLANPALNTAAFIEKAARRSEEEGRASRNLADARVKEGVPEVVCASVTRGH